MAHVIYNKETTVIICERPSWRSQYYATAASAKAALTRMSRTELADKRVNKDEYAIAEAADFHANIEKKRTVTNLMSGKEFEEAVNTSGCCSPSTETYWSM